MCEDIRKELRSKFLDSLGNVRIPFRLLDGTKIEHSFSAKSCTQVAMYIAGH